MLAELTLPRTIRYFNVRSHTDAYQYSVHSAGAFTVRLCSIQIDIYIHIYPALSDSTVHRPKKTTNQQKELKKFGLNVCKSFILLGKRVYKCLFAQRLLEIKNTFIDKSVIMRRLTLKQYFKISSFHYD